MTTMSDALTAAVAAEQGAARVLSDLECAARDGVEVDPVQFASASGEVAVRRLRREALEAESAAAADAAEEATRRARLAALSEEASKDPALNPDRLTEMERRAKAAVEAYAEAIRETNGAFSRLVRLAQEAGLPLLDRSDASVKSGLVASTVMRRGSEVVYGPPSGVSLGNAFYRPARPGLLRDFAGWVQRLADS